MIIKRKLFTSTLEENVDLSSRVHLPNGMIGFKGKDGVSYYGYDPKNPRSLKVFDKEKAKEMIKLHDQAKHYEKVLINKTNDSIELENYRNLKRSLDGTSKSRETFKGSAIGALLGAGAGMALGGERAKPILIGAGIGAVAGGSLLRKLHNSIYKSVKDYEKKHNIK